MVDLAFPHVRTWKLSGVTTGAAVAGAVFLLAYNQGTFALTARQGLAIGVLWAVALTALAAPWTFNALRGISAIPALALIGLALFSLLSALWASSTEAALEEFDRCVLYAAVYSFAVVAIRRRHISSWSDGIAWGITAVGVVGLTSRLAPSVISSGHAFDFLPIANIRLSYPVGYWNALGVIVAIAIPLLLSGAVAWRSPPIRALSILPIPALAATLYLTSSRGGALATAVGALALILLSSRRWAVLASVVIAGAGSAVAVHALVVRRELSNGPLDSAAAVSQRGGAAVQIALACVITAVAYAIVVYGWSVVARPFPPMLERAAAALVVVATVAAVIALHPIRQFHDFRSSAPPAAASANYVQAHLLSARGNGRWQLWSAGMKEFRAHPLLGTGAGSFKEWWMQHRPFALFVLNAHSLYIEVLGELGVVGFMFLLGIIVPAAIAVVRIVRGADAQARANGAAVAAALIAFLVAAAFEWMWQVTAVTIVALVALALLVRLAPSGQRGRAVRNDDASRPQPVRPEAAVAGWIAGAILLAALVYAQAAPLLSQRKLEASYAATRNGDLQHAYRMAVDARDLTPWDATPYLQAALVEEQLGRLGHASKWVKKAIDRDPKNWQLWLVATRLAVKQGQIEGARRDLAQASALNPLALGSHAVP